MESQISKHFEYEATPQTRYTDLRITTVPGSEIEFTSSFAIRTANAVVASDDIIAELETIPSVVDARYGWKPVTTIEGEQIIDTNQEHTGELIVSIKKGVIAENDSVVSEVFKRIFGLVFENEEHTRRVETDAEEYANSRRKKER